MGFKVYCVPTPCYIGAPTSRYRLLTNSSTIKKTNENKLIFKKKETQCSYQYFNFLKTFLNILFCRKLNNTI